MQNKPSLHKHYLLYDEFEREKAWCDECNRKIYGLAFACEYCKFWLHKSCAEKRLPSRISQSASGGHSQYLFLKIDDSDFVCDKCFSLSRGCRYSISDNKIQGGSFQLDVICAFSTDGESDQESKRWKDMGKQIQHFIHEHHLTLFNYRKHVEAKAFQCGSTSSLKQDERKQNDIDADFPSHNQIGYFNHGHPLKFKVFGKDDKRLCLVCNLDVSGHHGYVCDKCVRYHLHKACAELSYELRHPLHTQHPLNLVPRTTFALWDSKNCICNHCRDVFDSWMYYCFRCNFNLDIKCAVGSGIGTTDQKQGLNLQEIERPTSVFHFLHRHELLFGNCRPTIYRNKFWCQICLIDIAGPGYCCLKCDLYVHESCLGKLARQIQLPSHPHPLYAYDYFVGGNACLACPNSSLSLYGYKCSECPNTYIHYCCAASLKRRPLRSISHSHNLYFFQRDKVKRLISMSDNCCKGCGKNFGQLDSIYRCIECSNTNFHLRCVKEISRRLKSKRHIHPLTLKDSFVEDDSREYYCDICEEERDANDDIYYCEECRGHFVAHIDCAVAEVEEVLEP